MLEFDLFLYLSKYTSTQIKLVLYQHNLQSILLCVAFILMNFLDNLFLKISNLMLIQKFLIYTKPINVSIKRIGMYQKIMNYISMCSQSSYFQSNYLLKSFFLYFYGE